MRLRSASAPSPPLRPIPGGKPSRVILGPTRSYELLDDPVGRAGIRTARVHGELGFTKLVAVKTLRSEDAATVHALVVDESRLRHANILATLDVVVDGATVHVIMEYVEGPSLADILGLAAARGTPLSVPVAAALIHDVLLGLEHAHGAHEAAVGDGDLIRCDVSPRNVVVGFDGLARIVDVGLPAGGLDDLPQGKRAYVPPELRSGGASGHSADAYACGIMLWQLLTATCVPGARPTRVGAYHRGADAVDAVIARATNPDPRARFATAAEMAWALRRATSLASRVDVGEAIVELPNVQPPRSGTFVGDATALRRSARTLSFAARVMLVLTVLGIVLLALALAAGPRSFALLSALREIPAQR
jgi:serine/threonine-protein kinase